MKDGELRDAIRDALRSLNSATEARIRQELGRGSTAVEEALRFEICPHFHGVQCVQTEEEIVPDAAAHDALPGEVREAAVAAEIDWHAVLDEEYFPWLAERWEAAGGERGERGAYAFFHGGPDAPLYDLTLRRWRSAREVWGDDD